MSAISSKARLKTADPYRYNAGSELEEELDYYNTFYRKYDAQIGRFTGVDIRSEESAAMSVYNFGANNPVMFNDPTGAYFSAGNPTFDLGGMSLWSYVGFNTGFYAQSGIGSQFGGNTLSGMVDRTDPYGGGGGGGIPALSSRRLAEIASRTNGIISGRPGVAGEIGRAFQNAAFDAFSLGPPILTTENIRPIKPESIFRRFRTGGKYKKIQPDGYGIVVDKGLVKYNYYVEVKAVNGRLSASYQHYQLSGMIDALANSNAGVDGVSALFIVGLKETIVGNSLIKYANERKVTIFQITALDIGNNQIAFGPAIPLNNPQLKLPIPLYLMTRPVNLREQSIDPNLDDPETLEYIGNDDDY